MRNRERVIECLKVFPKLYFDKNETLLPSKMGYFIYRKGVDKSPIESPTFPRRLSFIHHSSVICEFSLWYDADISHLYELEHIWVYADDNDKVVKIEASFHGSFSGFSPEDKLLVEPGKHAHCSSIEQFPLSIEESTRICENPGSEGLLIIGLNAPELQDFKEELRISYKNEEIDGLIREDFQKYAFTPSYEMIEEFIPSEDILCPWEELREYIKTFLYDKLSELKAKSGEKM